MQCQISPQVAISIHALLAESDRLRTIDQHTHRRISIHALLAESDMVVWSAIPTIMGISIHALLAESDQRAQAGSRHNTAFLSTLSLRRATDTGMRHQRMGGYFYPRSPCGERRQSWQAACTLTGISIHALLAESDCWKPLPQTAATQFLSTLSLRRATMKTTRKQYIREQNFYPRSPCGERHGHGCPAPGSNQISIHALLAESDTIYPHSP